MRPRRAPESGVMKRTPEAAAERRDRSPAGIARRARFELSLKQLADLGLSPRAVEYYRRLARKRRCLPHEVVCAMAEEMASPELIVFGLMGLNAV
jgi:hypothetical protein